MGLQHKSIRPSSPPIYPIELHPSAASSERWHLGFCNWKYTPIKRGFDSFYGYLYGSKDYYLHDAVDTFEPELKVSSWLRSGPLSLISSSVRLSRELDKNGFGFWNNDTVDTTVVDRYATEVFSEQAVKIIERHNKSTPLFLYLAFKSPHGPLQVPARFERMYSRIRRKARRKYCGMVSALDEAVGNVTRALQTAGMMDNLLLVFTSDNGGAVYEGANNLPLRGAKTTLWEGGTRAAAFVFSKTLLQKRAYTHTGLFHAVDWFPTMAHVAGVPPSLTRNQDGVNQWDMLSKGRQSRRQEFLYNIDELDNNAAVRLGDWKLIVGRPGIYNRWYPLGDTKWANRTEFKRDRFTDNSTYLLYNIREDQEERKTCMEVNLR
ncbi:LOW QUALITY PROTEIN: arylsulfatase I-like [Pomacea canaliculata]|uniref:LOW QUALITY PROTEIN: arylsulfatase I-like n=1 Tax=Pomacea canaliculata TaxID=400727 RepID=UPI000D7395D6|nr:LOW QUALITY PROTEIN: arylsulfatase I-like [Pomacea canaliculata]